MMRKGTREIKRIIRLLKKAVKLTQQTNSQGKKNLEKLKFI